MQTQWCGTDDPPRSSGDLAPLLPCGLTPVRTLDSADTMMWNWWSTKIFRRPSTSSTLWINSFHTLDNADTMMWNWWSTKIFRRPSTSSTLWINSLRTLDSEDTIMWNWWSTKIFRRPSTSSTLWINSCTYLRQCRHNDVELMIHQDLQET